jgi:hypothetical protein
MLCRESCTAEKTRASVLTFHLLLVTLSRVSKLSDFLTPSMHLINTESESSQRGISRVKTEILTHKFNVILEHTICEGGRKTIPNLGPVFLQ